MSHTPGPWEVATKQDCDEEGCCGESVYDRECGVFAVIEGDLATVATPWLESDARLIAAAPELLEALEEIIASNPSILATERSALRYVQAVEKARKVIDKARGEE
ncbi:hypothetical protein SAMN06275492_11277 [Dethiosulfovibrio salsuginis]|uniref:Uncharacterized protein n=1 Tax=Dethiosulfovibrio salsuginis TaxID=561720 RepID=A0A1X7JJC5_9BACT|nr:hypothetical protein SAMN06275492_11277 [Dethiosulfovibrio salsuginis]